MMTNPKDRDMRYQGTVSLGRKSILALLVPPLAIGAGMLIPYTPYLPVWAVPLTLALILSLLLTTPFFLRARPELFGPVSFVAVIYVGYATSTLKVVREGLYMRQLSLSPSGISTVLATVLVYAIVGIIAFYLGYYVRFGTIRMRKPGPISFQAAEEKLRVKKVVFLYSVIGLLFYIFFMDRQGGLLYFITHPFLRSELTTGYYLDVTTSYYVVWAASLFPVATLVWFTHSAQRRKGKLLWVHLAISSFMLATFGARIVLFSFWLCVVVVQNYASGKRINALWLCVVGLLVLALSIAGLAFRRVSQSALGFDWELFRSTLGSYYSPKSIFDFLGGDDLADVHILSLLVVDMPFGLQYGKTFLYLLTSPIPRALWPNKPVEVSAFLGRIYFQERSGIPPSFLGELFMNFGVPGIIVGMFLFGLGSQFLYSYLKRNLDNKWAVLIYAICVTKFVLTLTGSAFMNAAQHLLWHLLPTVLAIRYIGRSSRDATEVRAVHEESK